MMTLTEYTPKPNEENEFMVMIPEQQQFLGFDFKLKNGRYELVMIYLADRDTQARPTNFKLVFRGGNMKDENNLFLDYAIHPLSGEIIVLMSMI